MSVEPDVFPILRYLGAGAVSMEPKARQAVNEACMTGDPLERLTRSARVVGLEMITYEISPYGLGAGVSALPLVGHGAGHGAYFVLDAVRNGRVRVRVFGPTGPGAPNWMSTDAFAAAVGRSPDHPLRLMRAVVSRPLELLRNVDGSAWRRLGGLIKSERRDLGVVISYAIGVGVLSLATPLAVQSLINTVAFGTVMQPVLVLSVLLLAALIASAVLKLFELIVVEHLARRVFVRTAVDFSRRVPVIRKKGCGEHRLEELMNRFYDVVVVEKSVVSLIFDGLAATLQIGLGLLLLAVYHPILLAFDLGLIFTLAVIVFGLGRHAVKTAVTESKKKHAVAAWLEELASTPSAFASVSGQRYAHGRADEAVQAWLHARAAHFKVLIRQQGGMLGLQALASGLLILIGGFLVLERQLTLGQLVAAEVIMTLTVSSLAKLGKLLSKVYDLLAALDKLGSVIDLPLIKTGSEALEPSSNPMAVELQHPSLQLSLPAGRHIAVNSERLLGLPEFIPWLAGLGCTPPCGTLSLDGIDARSLNAAEVADQILVLHRDELFDGTLIDNITLGDPRASRAEVRDALAQVGLGDLEDSLSEGLDHPIQRDGHPVTLSESSLVLFARLLVRRPRMVLVDRLLDTLSTEHRSQVMGILLAKDAPWTAICVTDQPSILRAFPCDLAHESDA